MKKHVRTLAAVLVVTLAARPASATDWPSWRGPNQDGTVVGSGAFPEGPFGLEVQWKRLLGAGYSGMSVAGDKLLTLYTDGVDDFAAALDATSGRELWRFRLGPMYRGHDGGHDGPVSTPVADADTVFALGADGRFVALELDDGRERWSVSLAARFGASEPFWGFTTTPAVVDDVVIVQAGGTGNRGLVALDVRDGTTRWTRGGGQVDYRSPIVATLHERRQVIACTGNRVSGVDPATGDVIWSTSFSSAHAVTPVAIGSDLVLVGGRRSTVLLRVPPDGGRPTEVWRTQELRGNYAIPTVHGDHLYGFTGGNLTCVELGSGKRTWRSRTPGGKGLIIVDGRLVIFGTRGDVVVADASPDGYRERARVSVSDADGYAWPCFADGVFFVRSLRGDVAAVRAVPGETVAARFPAPATPAGAFATFLERLGLAPDADKASMLDRFMAEQAAFPIVEDNRHVHFVYRGPARDVAILGNMIAQSEADPLHRVPGTDLFHRSYPIEPGARWGYQFDIDFGHIEPDPLNRRRIEGVQSSGQPVSAVITDGWFAPWFLEPYEEKAPGGQETFRANGRRIEMYLPHGYEAGSRRYPLVVVNDGDAWLDEGALPNTLNNLNGVVAEPCLVAFVEPQGFRDLGGNGTASYVHTLASEIVPAIDERYRTRTDPASRIVFGHRAGAVAAVCAALARPDVFGNCAAISFGRADTVRAQWIGELIAGASKAPSGTARFHVTWNRYEIWKRQSFDCREQSRDLVADLEAAGYVVTGVEQLDCAGWGAWRIQAGDAITALLPKSRR